jgi:hypothetical protein
MLKSKSENQIKTNIKDVYISQVQYKSCGMTIVSSKKKLDFYIDKRASLWINAASFINKVK